MPLPLLFHILGGLTGVFAGFATLVLRKGSIPHQNIGRLFVVSMLIMGLSGTYQATFIHPQPTNAVAGLFVAYLVMSGWLTGREAIARIGRRELAVMFVGVATALGSLVLAYRATRAPVAPDSDSATGFIVFSALLALGVAGDLRVWIRGGISGAQRLARHLWRLCLALFMAVNSLFLATPSRILPAWIAETPVRFVLPIAVTGLFLYWLVRTLWLAARERRARLPKVRQLDHAGT
jgi:hypothetical protein